MTRDELQTWLVSQGYKPFTNHHTGAVWCGAKRLPTDAPGCETNAHKVSWHVRLYEVEAHGVPWRSCEVEICGERGGQWYRLLAYEIAPETMRPNLTAIEQRLLAAWVAVGVDK
jgi:hypothetical protein